MPSLYLINPAENAPGYFGTEVLGAWGLSPLASMADLATTTVAAFVPPDWQVSICDERLLPVDMETSANIIGLTGKVSQRERIIALAAQFRARGKLVVIGGPYASLNPEDMRPHADVLVIGEIEEIAAQLFADLAAGRQQAEYRGTKPDLGLSPLPRWDLYPRGLAISAQVQTSRGCPFECEFCDVIQYLGRKQRWKEPDQVLRELEQLHGLGYRSIFLADDNLTVVRRRAHALLESLAEWNRARGDQRMDFSTQVSIDIARDAQMLSQMRAANFENVFIGIETPNEASLAETRKRQNLRIDLAAEVGKIVEAGMMVICGLIVGFDNDGPDIFERQAEFIQRLPVPLPMVGLLVAPFATPLYARLQKEGRLLSDAKLGAGSPLQTNIRPLNMSSETLRAGMRWLFNRVYHPAAIAQRVEHFAARAGMREAKKPAPFFQGGLGLLGKRLLEQGEENLVFLRAMEKAAQMRPDLTSSLANVLVYYCQSRHMLSHHGLWDPELGRLETPRAA